jgi:hypothetical protein
MLTSTMGIGRWAFGVFQSFLNDQRYGALLLSGQILKIVF